MSVTIQDRIRAAHNAARHAEAERNRLMRQAREQGMPVAALGELVGVPASTAWRWTGGKDATKAAALRARMRAGQANESPAPLGTAGASANKE